MMPDWMSSNGWPSGSDPGSHWQFERHGYFVADRIDHRAAQPDQPGQWVFNRVTGLKDGVRK
jgi:glutaminyl-tRNA synthetase